MDTPHKILVPVDLSTRAESAIDYAAMLARHLGSWLVLMVNINLPERAVLEDLALAEGVTVDEAAHIMLKRYGTDRTIGTDVTCIVTHAEFPADAILDAVEVHDIDMVVVASHGRSGMTRWLLGSIAEKIARASTVPVVIVPARDRPRQE